ncbi:MAG: AAA domain-containing protein [Planctomycetaceae bacterium]|nr:AAA domain-containing protein [Planctomycetaceae bacterium]
MHFQQFLHDRLASGGFTTEDVLSSFLPLLRQTIEAHEAGHVAPLDGLAALQVEGVQIWFAESALQKPAANLANVKELQRSAAKAVEILREARLTHDVHDGTINVHDFSIGRPDEELKQPVYLPGYACWEHHVEHHDPLTDTFSLGLILASLGCGVDVGDPTDLERFVANRRNLFALNPDLHPVLARIIGRMTELQRDRRPQDLGSLLCALANYRDQPVDFELDLATAAGFRQRDRTGKQHVILGKLQERLFEVSKRNHLLDFKPTLQSVNLTQASVPLSFDCHHLRPDQIFVWNNGLHDAIAAGKTVSLNSHLNFREAVYLPSVLDRIRLDALRDRTEYGFAQLRLVACMLRWADLKQSPPVMYRSPLVLIPVELRKQKGIRDTWSFEPLETVAEINPVVRHLFQQLYAISLPEAIDLTHSSLDDLFELMARAIEANEPAVALHKIDRPRIELIHNQARRRLDQYVRRARLYGRGVRSFMDLEYSYDRVNYHPMGLKLYCEFVRPAVSHLEAVLGKAPTTRQFLVAPEEPTTAVAEQKLYQLREEADSNPFTWEFDLCSLTLGNFRYRKMSLVRDYDALQIAPVENPPFEATFSLAPRDVEERSAEPLPLAERFHVVSCDPTQAAAISEARRGQSYIIQGPPGTGKSQTIANLIADYVARGQRVLFVCEKRAAIDVVFHRLQQQQLDRLCCLIHDSQSDKRGFVMDLKRTYEEHLGAASDDGSQHDRRPELIADIQEALVPLERFQKAMTATHDAAGIPTRELLSRLAALRDNLPDLSPVQIEFVPQFAAIHAARGDLQRLNETLSRIRPDGVLARHPLRWLSPRITEHDRPLDFAIPQLRESRQLLPRLESMLAESGMPPEHWSSLEKVERLIRHAGELVDLAERNLIDLLRPKSARSKQYRKHIKKVGELAGSLAKQRDATRCWRQKLSPEMTASALWQAQSFAHDRLKFLKPGWWGLRAVLHRACEFQAAPIRPTWVDVLTWLNGEHAAQAAWEAAEKAARDSLEIEEPLAKFDGWLKAAVEKINGLDPAFKACHEALLSLSDADACVQRLADCAATVEQLRGRLDGLLDGVNRESLSSLSNLVCEVESALPKLSSYLGVLKALPALPPDVLAALRTLPLSLTALEAAAAHRTWNEILHGDLHLAEFSTDLRSGAVNQLDKLTQQWLEVNAAAIRGQVRDRFLEHVRLSTAPAAQLTTTEKTFQRSYARGRRELEHEFGKSMRYKSIRDLVSGDSGLVVRDLKPVWLMSPLSVSDTLPLDEQPFDVVIFDEASQITLEEAVPSLFRAAQAIVVGDQMQLPPTDFFSAKRNDDEEGVSFTESGKLIQYDLESDSFLNHSARNLPSRMLGWHYRSRSESLISFSNAAFYQGRLLTVPEESIATGVLPEVLVASATDGMANAAAVFARAISFHLVERGVYDQRRNRPEAEYIAELVRGFLRAERPPTLGIIAFSEAQQDEIQSALDRLADEDRALRERMEAELEREEGGQFAGLLVKNLENIQGDERDVVILSVCYGPDQHGRMRMNFGPINQSGGEKRLNVAFSRAKRHMVIVSSIRSTAITNDYNVGANCLKSYLAYAEACSRGDRPTVRRILRTLTAARDAEPAGDAARDVIAGQIAAALRERGYLVDPSIGQSHFRCDLAVRRPDEARYRLGILLDTAEWYAQTDLLERELMKPKLLASFGWTVVVVLAKEWWEHPRAVLDSLERRMGVTAERTETPTLTE